MTVAIRRQQCFKFLNAVDHTEAFPFLYYLCLKRSLLDSGMQVIEA